MTDKSSAVQSAPAAEVVASSKPAPANQASTATLAVAPASSATASTVMEPPKQVTPDAFANGFATLVGALLAAALAYWFQTRSIRNQEHRLALLSAHRTMFSLLQQVNTIVLIQRDYVHSELDNPARFISIPATPPFDPTKNVLNVNDLAFLLDTTAGREVLYELYIAQENYVEAINHWNLRSLLHAQQVQPALAAAALHPGVPVTMADIESALGKMLLGQIINATENALITLRRGYEKLAACKGKVRSYAVQRFKSNDFTDFDFPDDWGLTTKNPT